jgi:hypothetical protein
MKEDTTLIFRTIAASGLLVAALAFPARADVILAGPDSNDGSYSTTALAGLAGTDGTVTSGGVTGIALWALLGGANASSSTSPVYGAITTSTPVGDNNKNAIFRYYLVATNATGQQSVVSLGEIDPNFGGTASPAPFIAYKNTGGQFAEPNLVVPSQPNRGLTNVTSLQILSVPALPQGAENVQSAAVQLSGNVNAPGSYSQTALQSLPSVTETIGTDVYTGVPLWSFLNPTSGGSTNQIVVTQATDGYEVVLALAELDPVLGAVSCGPSVNTCDILPYADTTGAFPGDGVARTIYPEDSAHGRWQSNLNMVTVQEAPEPASLTLLAVGLAATVWGRRGRKHVAAT